MQYNSEKSTLIIPEYGRNVQLLIEYTKTLEEKAHRQAYAETVIALMHQMNPQNKSIDDYIDKLWKHFFRIAQYDIDVDTPNGQTPTPEDARKRPDRIAYPASDARYRHYGLNVQKLIQKAIDMPDGPKKEGFVGVIGSYMKLAYRTWNKEHYISDEIIKNDLSTLSKGQLEIKGDIFLDSLSNSNSHSNNNNNHRKKHHGKRSNHSKGGYRGSRNNYKKKR